MKTSRSFTVMALLFVVGTTACSGGTGTLPPNESASGGVSSGGASSGGASSSSGGTSTPTDPAPSPSPDAPIDAAGVTTVTIALGYCGGAAGQCYGQKTYAIDLGTGVMSMSGCGFGPADGSSVTLASGDVASLERELAAVRVAPNGSSNQDGRMFVLQLDGPSGQKLYSPASSCNHSAFGMITSGFDRLWSFVEARGNGGS